MWITPILASLPPWWRLLQCIRRYKDSGERVHLINAGKYVTSICATALTGVRRINSMYIYLSDKLENRETSF
jgi:EXS family